MAFVPGHKHDLFLSYARAESSWVTAFRTSLSQRILEKIGAAPQVWYDLQEIDLGEDWPEEIGKGIRDSAAFLAVCSPAYFQSEWCAKEYETFAPEGSLQGLSAGSYYRFLKVIKTPDAEKAYKQFFTQLQAIEFFNKSNEEYLPGSPEFDFHVGRAASAIAELLRTMRNSKQALYVGTATADMRQERAELCAQLSDYRYDVRPRLMLTPALAGLVEKELQGSLLAIFVLGGAHDRFVEEQIKAAKDMKRRLIVWAHPRKAKSIQTELLDRLLKDAAEGSQVLASISVRDFIQDLVGLLAPQPLVGFSGENSQSVYLVHDANHPAEAERADRLRRLLLEQQFTVVPNTTDVSLTPEMHERFMRECAGLLLYRGRMVGPDRWLYQNLSEIQLAEKMYALAKPLKAKTFLLADPAKVDGVAGLDVLPYSDPPTVDLLAPFFKKMRQERPEDARN